MIPDRIFVSYAITDDLYATAIANLLIKDLQTNGVTVLTEREHEHDSEADFSHVLESELAACQYLILVQTPAACQSQHVQLAVQAAQRLLDRQHILRIIAIPSPVEDEPPLWHELRTYDASQDYPRVREKIFLELGLTSLDATSSLLFTSPLVLQSANRAASPAQDTDPIPDVPSPSPQGSAQTASPQRYSLKSGSRASHLTKPQDARAIDRPPPLPLHTRPLFRRSVIITCLMITILSTLAGFVLVYKMPSNPVLPKPPRSTPTAVVQQPTTPRSTPTATTQPINPFLAQDTFQRADQQGWGTASDGHPWGVDATNGPIFSIQQGKGTISGGQGTLNATLGPQVKDAEVFFTGSINLFHQSNLGAVLRWKNAGTFYKAYIDGHFLVLLKSIDNHMTSLNSVPFAATGNAFYNLRFRIEGATLSARAWPQNTPEPAQWMVSAQDDALHSGLAGIRVRSEPADTITITAFQEMPITPSFGGL